MSSGTAKTSRKASRRSAKNARLGSRGNRTTAIPGADDHAEDETMTDLENGLARRAVLAGLGAAAAATVVMPAQGATAVPAEGEIWSREYWTKKGDIPLWMFRKRIGAPRPGEPARPVLFFVHGSSITSRVFDLNVPGKGEYSAMNEFARYGFDCWTVDHENYGKSGRTSGNADI